MDAWFVLIWLVLIALVLLTWGAVAMLAWNHKRKWPFVFECEKCDFTFKSNSQYAIDVVRLGHKHPTD